MLIAKLFGLLGNGGKDEAEELFVKAQGVSENNNSEFIIKNSVTTAYITQDNHK